MTADAQKNELLEQFQSYLEQTSLEPLSSNEQPDLHTLLAEFTGLKTEVKTESRHFKNTLDTLSSALVIVQEDNKALSKELAESAQRMEQKQDEIMRTMLLEFVDIYDRLTAGMEILQNYHPVKSTFKCSRKHDIKFIKRFEEGQNMTLKRLDQLLQNYQVSTIDCVDKMFDPATMRAIEAVSDKRTENGIVLEELRTGFLYKNKVLRLAEVKVNSVKII